jgi:hypothetical protein
MSIPWSLLLFDDLVLVDAKRIRLPIALLLATAELTDPPSAFIAVRNSRVAVGASGVAILAREEGLGAVVVDGVRSVVVGDVGDGDDGIVFGVGDLDGSGEDGGGGEEEGQEGEDSGRHCGGGLARVARTWVDNRVLPGCVGCSGELSGKKEGKRWWEGAFMAERVRERAVSVDIDKKGLVAGIAISRIIEWTKPYHLAVGAR